MGSTVMGIGAFDPVSNVTPFTYRDGGTYLTILRKLQDKLNEVIEHYNEGENANAVAHSLIVSELTNLIAESISSLRKEFEGINDEYTVADPTTGRRVTGLTQALGNVYDNTRVFAYFASELDERDLTAAAMDAANSTARHFDLGATWPNIHDDLETV